MKYGNEVTSKYAKIGDTSFWLKPLELQPTKLKGSAFNGYGPVCECDVMVSEWLLTVTPLTRSERIR